MNWLQQTLVNNITATVGTPVALDGLGNTLIFGRPGRNTPAGITGGVRVYNKNGDTWDSVVDLVGFGNIGPCRQGSTISISFDGTTIVTGGSSDNNAVGSAWVFSLYGGIWSQQGPKLVGTGSSGQSNMASSISISDDGNTIVSGGPRDNNGIGAVWVFTRNLGIWSQYGSKLVGSGYSGSCRQGRAVSISGDGLNFVVGAPVNNGGIGAVWVFTLLGGVWTEQTIMVPVNYVGSIISFGTSVSMSYDGNVIAVGGSDDNSRIGATWIFTKIDGAWTQDKIVGDNVVGESEQGKSVSLSQDGSILAVGGPGDNAGRGATWIFEKIDGLWTQQSKIIGIIESDLTGIYRQGGVVSLSKDGLTVASGSYPSTTSTGSSKYYFSHRKI